MALPRLRQPDPWARPGPRGAIGGRPAGLWLDAVMAGGAFVGGLVVLSIGLHNVFDVDWRTPRAAFVAPLLVSCVAVLLRRVATRTSLAVGTVAVLADTALGGSLATMLVYSQVLYDACVHGPPRLWRWLLWLSGSATVAGAVAGIVRVRGWSGVWVGIVVALVATMPVLTGVSVRGYRNQAATARAVAEQTARLAALDRRQAVLAERTRMARELHDVVANHLSAVAIHAAAALNLPSGDEGVRTALGVIRSSGVQGLAEMRRMIELLRDDGLDGGRLYDGLDGIDLDSSSLDHSGPPAGAAEHTGGHAEHASGHASGGYATDTGGAVLPGLAESDGLLERANAAGLAVSMTVVGTARPLPAAVDLAAYRILQESLTNALKHGDGRAEVTVSYADGLLRMTVDNPVPDGRGAGDDRVPGAGAGLIGMRERADLLNGSLAAGPVTGGRWRVRADLPTNDGRGDRTGTTTTRTGRA